jgi:hypothetical protein
LKLKNIFILLAILAVLGGVFYVVARPKPPPPVKPQEYVWLIDQEDINHVIMSLPRENPPLSQSFIMIKQGDKFPWFFDDPQRSPVDSQRWGGGIPLLLSGPGADRVITDNATPDRLTAFGLDNPSMEIVLEVANRPTMYIEVGDATPDGQRHYVKAPGTNAVATVDYTWFTVLEKLIRDPPYAKPATTKP